jgi:hemoglobin
MNDIASETDIDFLVETFYNKLKKNEKLAPFFIHTNWEHHLPRMKQFWHFIILDKPGFKGNIYDAHSNKQIKSPHFDVWLQLFCDTVNENFKGINSTKATEKARELSMLFSWKLEETEGK